MESSSKKRKITLALLLSCAFLILASLVMESRSRYYGSSLDRKTLLIFKILRDAGYGGAIHNFKNYVLRGQETYYHNAKKQLQDIFKNISEFQKININTKERQDLEALRRTLVEYYENLELVKLNQISHEKMATIDQAVKVDDTTAIFALHQLGEAYIENAGELRRTNSVRSLLFILTLGVFLCYLAYSYKVEIQSLEISENQLSAANASLMDLNNSLDQRVRAATSDLEKRSLDLEAVNSQLTSAIARQEQVELELLKSEERFMLATDGASVGIFDWLDIGNDQAYFSGKFMSMLGYPYKPWEFVSFKTFTDHVFPDDLQRVQEQLNQALEGRNDFNCQYRLAVKGGSYRWFKGTGVVARGVEGKATRMVGSIQDIDLQKMLEVDLSAQKEEMENFLYTVSHDLKSPLVTIGGYAERLLEGDLEPDKVQHYLQRINLKVVHMSDLLADLLEISRISRVPVRFETLDFNQLLAEILDINSEMIQSAEATITSQALPQVVYDRKSLGQVLTNLLLNALKYRHEARPPKIEIYSHEAKDELEVSIRDNGIGIPSDKKEVIFNIFERVHPSLASGTGIGLAITKTIVEKHKGRIWVDSIEGEGSTFTFSIPMTQTGVS